MAKIVRLGRGVDLEQITTGTVSRIVQMKGI